MNSEGGYILLMGLEMQYQTLFSNSLVQVLVGLAASGSCFNNLLKMSLVISFYFPGTKCPKTQNHYHN